MESLTVVKAPVSLTRSSLGHGEVNAGVLAQIVNHENVPLNVTYFEYLPWYLPIYFHSLRTFLDSTSIPLPSCIYIPLPLPPSISRF